MPLQGIVFVLSILIKLFVKLPYSANDGFLEYIWNEMSHMKQYLLSRFAEEHCLWHKASYGAEGSKKRRQASFSTSFRQRMRRLTRNSPFTTLRAALPMS